MVNDVLRLRRSDSAHRESFKVVDYLKTFVEQFCQIEKINPEIFEIELHADPRVLFDRSHLNQVMWNLCRNAAAALPARERQHPRRRRHGAAATLL